MVFLVEYVKNTIKENTWQVKKIKKNADKSTIDIGNRPQISVSISYATSTNFTPLSNLPEGLNPPTGSNIANPPPGHYYDM